MDQKLTRNRWNRRFLTIVTVTVLLLVLALPAFAITYGVPDGNAHPFVGSMVLRLDGNLYQVCTGTLISADVFLTASHCTVFLDDFLADNPGSELLVTFDPVISDGSTFYTGQWYTNPEYISSNDAADPGDIAVIVLDQAPGIEPASLPTAGLLDQLKASHILKNTRFTAVGYGTIREQKTKGPQAILDNMERRQRRPELPLPHQCLDHSVREPIHRERRDLLRGFGRPALHPPERTGDRHRRGSNGHRRCQLPRNGQGLPRRHPPGP